MSSGKRRRNSSRHGPTRHSWGQDWDANDLNEQNTSQADREWACKQACEMLQIEYCENDMSARTLCVLAYFCVMAGMQGEVGKFAKHPDCQTGKYQEHLDRALNVEDVKNKEYHIRASLGSRKKNNLRNVDDFLLFPPHECLVDELANSDETIVKLKQRVLANAEYTLAYGNNPIVLGSSETERESLLPYAIYLDGTAFSARRTNYDSVTGFFSH
jgi:hypothetical protein